MLLQLSSSVKTKRHFIKNAMRTCTFCDWHAGAFAGMILFFGKRKQLLMSLYRFDRQKKYLLRYAKA